MNKLIMMVGIPASGKDLYFRQKLCAESNC
jgi:predicted kinase